jgi:tetratricopeptide (TPR) repeat protein
MILKRNLLSYFCALIAIQSITAQVTLRGTTLLFQSNKQPLSGVKISALGAKDTTSDAEGNFVLKFDTLNVGSEVRLTFSKTGFETTSDHPLSLRLPEIPHVILYKPFAFRPEGTILKEIDQYFGVFKVKVSENYKRQLAELQRKYASLGTAHLEYRRVHTLAANDYAATMQQARVIAEKLARFNPDLVTPETQEVLKLFGIGAIDSVCAIWKYDDLYRQWQSPPQSLYNKGDSMLLFKQEKITQMLFLARALSLKQAFSAAETIYERLSQIDGFECETMAEWATFLEYQQRWEKAAVFYKHAEQLSKANAYKAFYQNKLYEVWLPKPDTAKAEAALKIAANLYATLLKIDSNAFQPMLTLQTVGQGAYFENQKMFEKADSLYRVANTELDSVSAKNVQYLPVLAEFRQKYGDFYRKQNLFVPAEAVYLAALKNYKQLVKKYPHQYEPHVYKIQHKLAQMAIAKTQFRKADTLCSDAADLLKKLLEADSIHYKADWAALLTDWAKAFQGKNNSGQAATNYAQALELYKDLANANPNEYEGIVANIYQYLGVLNAEQNDVQSAEKTFQAALNMQKQLAETQPKTYLPQAAATLNQLGNLYASTADYVKSEANFTEALKLYQKLSDLDVQFKLMIQPEIAKTKASLGTIYAEQSQYPQAEVVYMEALAITKMLAAADPQYNNALAVTQGQLGEFYRAKNDFLKAEVAFTESLQLRSTAYTGTGTPAEYDPNIASTQANLAFLYKSKYEYEQSEAAYLKALGIYKRLHESNSTTYYTELIRTQYQLSDLYFEKKDYTKAQSFYESVLAAYRKLSETNPHTYPSDIASLLSKLGTIYIAKKDTAKAEQAILESLEIRKKLNDSNPYAYKSVYAVSLGQAAGLYYLKQDFEKSETLYVQTLDLRRKMAVGNPTQITALADAHTEMGTFYARQKSFVKADSFYQIALKSYKDLKDSLSEPKIANIQYYIGLLHFNTKNYIKSDSALNASLTLFQRVAKITPRVYTAQVGNVQNDLARLYKAQQNFAKADSMYSFVLALREKDTSGVGQQILQETWKDMANLYLEMADSEVKNADKVVPLQKAVGFCDKLYLKEAKNQSSAYVKQYAQIYGLLGVCQLFAKNFPAAESATRKALQLDEKQRWVTSNLAHALLLQGNYEEAEKIYKSLRNKKDEKGKLYKEVFLENLKDLEQEGVFSLPNEHIEKIRKLLK